MESRELRIGNYIHAGNGTIQKAISLNNYGGEEINEDTETGPFKGVVLTEEWLLKFSFTKVSEADSYPVYNVDVIRSPSITNVITVAFRSNETCVYIRDASDDKVDQSNGATIWHSGYDGELCVHHLQNIVYGLTQCELNVLPAAHALYYPGRPFTSKDYEDRDQL